METQFSYALPEMQPGHSPLVNVDIREIEHVMVECSCGVSWGVYCDPARSQSDRAADLETAFTEHLGQQ